jgi:peptidoglycan/xylan/chitin deacetylase (PgdA/CDA1 family)
MNAGTGHAEPRIAGAPNAGVAFMAWPTRMIATMSLRRICREGRFACLTYDDGPAEGLTCEVMSMLAAFHAKATFFAVGGRARDAGGVLDAAAARGHEIGCHTASHLNAWKAGRRAVEDVQRGYQELSKWVPADGMFRPPYGKMSLGTMREIRRRGGACRLVDHRLR